MSLHIRSLTRAFADRIHYEVNEDSDQMGLVARKPVFGVSNKARQKPVSSATQTSLNLEISSVARLHMILSKKKITKVLIRLRGCAGWSVPVLFASSSRQVFSHRGPIIRPQYLAAYAFLKSEFKHV